MANHYSGKRVAGRKPVGKRALSLLMALVMSLSLVQITAFAAVDTTGTTQKDAEVVFRGGSNNDGTVEVSKTVEKSNAGPNDFEITLTVTVPKDQTIETGKGANVVLVMDRSNSMNDGGGKGFKNAKKAATAFVNKLMEKGGNKVAVVGFGNNYEVSSELTGDKNAALKAVDAATKLFRVDRRDGKSSMGGTNIQAGIYAARNILADHEGEQNFIIVFSDGKPTFSYQSTIIGQWEGCYVSRRGNHHWNGGMFGDGKVASLNYTNFKYTKSFDQNGLAGDGQYYSYDARATVTCKHDEWKTASVPANNGVPAIMEAGLAKDAGAVIYSVYVGKDQEATDTMKKVASDGKYYSSDDMGKLAELFGGIVEEVIATTAKSVVDPMGAQIVLGDVSNLAGVTKTADGLTWNPTAEGVKSTENEDGSKTYEVTYPITLNTDAATGFAAGKAYETNGKTTFTYSVDNKEYTIDFPIPTVKGYDEPSQPDPNPEKVSYTVNYFLDLGGEMGYPREAQHSKEFSVPVGTTEVQILDLYNETLGFENVPVNYVLDEAMDDWGGVQPGTHTFAPVFNLYYKQAEIEPGKVTYTVNYFLEKDYGYNKMAPDYTVNGEQETVGQITIKDLYEAGFENVPAGYELDRATLDFDGVAPGEHSFTDGQVFNLYYKLAPIPMPEYTVEYYLKDSDTDKYEVKYSETFQAEFGEVTIAALKAAWTENVPADVNLDAYVLDADMLAEGYDGIAPGTHDFKEDGQVFKLYYKLAEVEPEGPFTYWVQHIYMNGETIDGKTYDEVTEVPYETEVDPMVAIEPVLKYTTEDGVEHVYEVESRDPMEKTLITKNDQVFTIFYQRNDPAPVEYTYSVKHIYLAPDGVTVEGKAELWDQGPVTAGKVVKADSIERIHKNTFNGTEYTYEFKSDSGDITVNDNNQVIELIYQRTASTPDPKPDPKPDPNPNPNPPTIIDDDNTPTTPADPGTDIEEPDVPVSPAQPPKTGDSMGLWIAAALVSGMGLVWLALSGKKREERA